MSDTYRRYRAIKHALMQFFQPRPTGHREKHLNTLVALICGLVGAKHAHLPMIADHAPSDGATQESLIKRFRRFLQHDAHTVDGWFLPIAQELLKTLAQQPIQLVMDGSVAGRGCLALMVSVVYHGRALPLCWVVVSAPKGHFPEETHRALLAQVQQIMPENATVVFLGDGEFDGCELQADLRRTDWLYVCRTASNILITACGVRFHVGDLGPPRGELLAVSPAWMTAEQYGPISILAIWQQQFKEPIYLVTNMSDLDEAVQMYKKRPHIETFFSDQKSRVCQVVCVNGTPLIYSAGKRPAKRIASWLRIHAQSCGGMVHFRVISRVTRNRSLRAASALGNEPLVLVTLRNCRLYPSIVLVV
jgi:hypothetical protein